MILFKILFKSNIKRNPDIYDSDFVLYPRRMCIERLNTIVWMQYKRSLWMKHEALFILPIISFSLELHLKWYGRISACFMSSSTHGSIFWDYKWIFANGDSLYIFVSIMTYEWEELFLLGMPILHALSGEDFVIYSMQYFRQRTISMNAKIY